jgi:DNA-binding response OmpR family regulator
MSRPIVLLVDGHPHTRLARVVALRGRYDVHTLDAGQEPIRLARRLRPDAVLLVLARGRLQGVLRTCRGLKTEAARAPKVGLLDPRARLSSPETALEACLGDGYLGGVAENLALQDFVDGLLDGSRPLVIPSERPGLLHRLLKR